MNDSFIPGEMLPDATRRGFLTRAAAAAAIPLVAGIFAGREWLQSGTPAVQSPAVLQLEHFQPHVGTVFTSADDKPLAFTLAKVETLKYHQPRVAEQFSLTFTAPAGHAFDSRVHTLNHPVLGRLELFISPVGLVTASSGAPVGEAVFNHVAQPV